MPHVIEENPAIDEKVWSAWVEKGKRADRATTRMTKIFASLIVTFGVIGLAVMLTSAK